jgi:hypothetical protein
LHRIAVGIVGEVGEDIESVDQEPLDLSGLDRQGLVRIAPTIVVFPPCPSEASEESNRHDGRAEDLRQNPFKSYTIHVHPA